MTITTTLIFMFDLTQRKGVTIYKHIWYTHIRPYTKDGRFEFLHTK